MTTFTIPKDPDADLDYAFKWASNTGQANDGTASDDGWLQADTLAVSIFIVSGPDASLVVHSDAIGDIIADDAVTVVSTNTLAGFWLSGGTPGRSYVVTNRITTTEGRTEDRSVTVNVAER